MVTVLPESLPFLISAGKALQTLFFFVGKQFDLQFIQTYIKYKNVTYCIINVIIKQKV